MQSGESQAGAPFDRETIMSDKNRAWRISCGVKVLDFLVELHNYIEKNDIDRSEVASCMGIDIDELDNLFSAKDQLTARQMFMLAEAVECDIVFKWPDDD